MYILQLKLFYMLLLSELRLSPEAKAQSHLRVGRPVHVLRLGHLQGVKPPDRPHGGQDKVITSQKTFLEKLQIVLSVLRWAVQE